MLKELLKYEGRETGLSGSPREIIKASYSCFDFLEEFNKMQKAIEMKYGKELENMQ